MNERRTRPPKEPRHRSRAETAVVKCATKYHHTQIVARVTRTSCSEAYVSLRTVLNPPTISRSLDNKLNWRVRSLYEALRPMLGRSLAEPDLFYKAKNNDSVISVSDLELTTTELFPSHIWCGTVNKCGCLRCRGYDKPHKLAVLLTGQSRNVIIFTNVQRVGWGERVNGRRMLF